MLVSVTDLEALAGAGFGTSLLASAVLMTAGSVPAFGVAAGATFAFFSGFGAAVTTLALAVAVTVLVPALLVAFGGVAAFGGAALAFALATGAFAFGALAVLVTGFEAGLVGFTDLAFLDAVDAVLPLGAVLASVVFLEIGFLAAVAFGAAFFLVSVFLTAGAFGAACFFGAALAVAGFFAATFLATGVFRV